MAVKGLFEIPQNPSYFLNIGELEGQGAFFHRTSYLCKAATKAFGDGRHGFGASRL